MNRRFKVCKAFVLALALCLNASAQVGQRVDTVTAAAPNGLLRALPGSTIRVCLWNAQLVCVTPVTTYKDPLFATPNTLLVADAAGNYDYFVPPGLYIEQVASTGFQTHTRAVAVAAYPGVQWPLLAPNGSFTAPSYSFASAPNTGMYNIGSDLGFVQNGTVVMFMRGGPVPIFSVNAQVYSGPDNTNDLGTSTDFRFRTGYFGTSVVSPLFIGGHRLTSFTGTKCIHTDVSGNLVEAAADCGAGAGVTWPLLAPDGTVGAPSYSFANETGLGFYRTAGAIRFAVSGSNGFTIGNTWVQVNGSSATLSLGGDVQLIRDAANTLSLRNAANPQGFRLYNTYTDASNYERSSVYWSANAFRIGTDSAGTGSVRDMIFFTNNTSRWKVDATNGHFLAFTDNTFDIGASGATRPRTVYAGTSVVAPLFSDGTTSQGMSINSLNTFATFGNKGSWWNVAIPIGSSNSGALKLGSNIVRAWSSDGTLTTLDTGLSRSAAGVVAVGNGTQGDFSGTVKAANINATTQYQLNGTQVSSSILSDQAALQTREFTYIQGCDTCAVMANTDDQAAIFWNGLGRTITIQTVACFADAGTTTIMLTNGASNIMNANLSCTAGGASTTSWNGTNNVVAASGVVNYQTVLADGTTKRVSVYVVYK